MLVGLDVFPVEITPSLKLDEELASGYVLCGPSRFCMHDSTPGVSGRDKA